jgi:hypothetical protein
MGSGARGDGRGQGRGQGTNGGPDPIAPYAGLLSPSEQRMAGLIEEFRRRQRRRPDLVVRPWWTPPGTDGFPLRLGFVMEYCPGGRDSVELAARDGRVTVEGPVGARDVVLDLGAGWVLGGVDAGSPEILANLLLRLADRALEEPA